MVLDEIRGFADRSYVPVKLRRWSSCGLSAFGWPIEGRVRVDGGSPKPYEVEALRRPPGRWHPGARDKRHLERTVELVKKEEKCSPGGSAMGVEVYPRRQLPLLDLRLGEEPGRRQGPPRRDHNPRMSELPGLTVLRG